MSQISFDQITSVSQTNNSNYVGFFGLSNDGDEAVVRIMHDSTDSFDIVTTHQIKIGNNFRRVNCIRNPHDPLDNCPFCASGAKVQQRIYIHLIQYVKDENGQIVAQPKVWERSASYATTVKNLIDEYGPLSDSIFKIRRNGAKGSMDTTYAIMYGNPQVYRSEYYPKSVELFDGYTAVGTAVMDKSFEELSEYLATGEFPQRTQNSTSSVTPQEDDSDLPFTMNSTPVPMNSVAPPVYQATASAGTPAWQNATPSVNKPVRYY